MRSQTRITRHGKKRIKERIDTNHKSSTLSRIASQNGKSKGFYQGAFHQYLLSKSESGARVKVYQNNIYILSKNTKRLITTYPVPNKYLPVEQYEIPDRILDLSYKLSMYIHKPIIVTLDNDEKLYGYIDDEYEPEISTKFILITEANDVLVELSNVKEIIINEEKMNEEIIEKLGV